MEENLNGSHPVRKERKAKERTRHDKQRARREHEFPNENNSHNLSWSNSSLMPPHRIGPSGDASYTPYPLHVSYPLEPFQFSLYPSVYPVPSPAPFCPVPPVRRGRKSECVSKRGDAKQLPRLASQQYASLPPVNCDAFSPKSSDSDTNSKRHYSDPGVGLISSEESDNSCESLTSPMYMNLIEEVRDLKEKCHRVSTELESAKGELKELKVDGCTKCLLAAYQPGSIADAVGELRSATQLREEAIFSRVDCQLELTADRHNQQLGALTKRLIALEEKFEKLESRETKDASVSTDQSEEDGIVVVDAVKGGELAEVSQSSRLVNAAEGAEPPKVSHSSRLEETAAPDAFTMLRALQEQKLELERELKQAVHGRLEAEASTLKLERLVAILRTKINGLSAEACLNEESQAQPTVHTLDRLPGSFFEHGLKASKVGPEDVHDKSSTLKCGGSLPCIISSNQKNSKPGIASNSCTASLISAKTTLPPPPSIPPRPAVFSPQRPKSSPPIRPPLAPQVADATSPPMTNFCIGKAVSPPGAVILKLECEASSESGSETLSPGPASLGATLTISGPVTDL